MSYDGHCLCHYFLLVSDHFTCIGASHLSGPHLSQVPMDRPVTHHRVCVSCPARVPFHHLHRRHQGATVAPCGGWRCYRCSRSAFHARDHQELSSVSDTSDSEVGDPGFGLDLDSDSPPPLACESDAELL